MPEAAAPARTLLEVVRLSTGYLAQHGSTSPRLDAELLAAHALHLRRIDLYLQFERPLADTELAAIRGLVRRRGQGEPVAYLTGVRDFFGRSFEVTCDVLIPRPDTETLVECALHLARRREHAALRIADLGTGSGCIAVTLACELPAARTLAVDVSEAALGVAARNVSRHEVGDRVQLVQGSWAAPLEGVVDVVVSNPPYVTSAELAEADRDVRDFEPREALDGGATGLDAYEALIESLPGHIAPAGAVLLEVDPRRAAQVSQLLAGMFPSMMTSTHDDLAGRTRVVQGQLPA